MQAACDRLQATSSGRTGSSARSGSGARSQPAARLALCSRRMSSRPHRHAGGRDGSPRVVADRDAEAIQIHAARRSSRVSARARRLAAAAEVAPFTAAPAARRNRRNRATLRWSASAPSRRVPSRSASLLIPTALAVGKSGATGWSEKCLREQAALSERRIYLVRHAEAEDVSSSGRDRDRALTDDGRSRTRRGPRPRPARRRPGASSRARSSALETADEIASSFPRVRREVGGARPAWTKRSHEIGSNGSRRVRT
jgi:hypothetical protein